MRAVMLVSYPQELLPQSPSPSPNSDRRHPLLNRRSRTSSSSSLTSGKGSTPKSSPSSCCSPRFGEVAGGTAAECAAVFCCCPCGLIHLLFLVICKLPAGLFRRAIRKRRKEKLFKDLPLAKPIQRSMCECDDDRDNHAQLSRNICVMGDDFMGIIYGVREEAEPKLDALESLEQEMWATFSGAGFWRSRSQRAPLYPQAAVEATIGRRNPSSSPTSPPSEMR